MGYASRFEKNTRLKRVYERRDQLLAVAVDYFQWCEANPLIEEDVSVYRGIVTRYNRERPRAFTWAGLLGELGLTRARLNKLCEQKEWGDVLEALEQIMHEQKFSYAAVGMMNASLVARDLGLADKAELSGPDGGPIESRNLSSEELEKELAARGLPSRIFNK